MRRTLLILFFLGAVSFQGVGVWIDSTQADGVSTVQPIALRYNCSWGCTEGHGGGGQANVTSASICAATCVAACGGDEANCAWYDYHAIVSQQQDGLRR